MLNYYLEAHNEKLKQQTLTQSEFNSALDYDTFQLIFYFSRYSKHDLAKLLEKNDLSIDAFNNEQINI